MQLKLGWVCKELRAQICVCAQIGLRLVWYFLECVWELGFVAAALLLLELLLLLLLLLLVMIMMMMKGCVVEGAVMVRLLVSCVCECDACVGVLWVCVRLCVCACVCVRAQALISAIKALS